MTSGVRVSRAVKREFFDLVCLGVATTEASVNLGMSRRTGWHWWRDAGGMKLRNGKNGLGGLAGPGISLGPAARAIGSVSRSAWRSCVAATWG